MKKFKLSSLGINAGDLLSREQLKNVTGGLGCNSHSDCPSGYACTMLTYMGAYQGVCCNSAELHDHSNVCGGGSHI